MRERPNHRLRAIDPVRLSLHTCRKWHMLQVASALLVSLACRMRTSSIDAVRLAVEEAARCGN